MVNQVPQPHRALYLGDDILFPLFFCYQFNCGSGAVAHQGTLPVKRSSLPSENWENKSVGIALNSWEGFLFKLKGLYQCDTFKKLIFFWIIRQFALLRIFCENIKVVSVIFFEWQSFKEEPLASVRSIGKSLNAFFSK